MLRLRALTLLLGLLPTTMVAAQVVDRLEKISNREFISTGTLEAGDLFGSALAGLGDLNNDGVTELAVGAPGDDDGGTGRGAVWILFLNSDGTVASQQKISATQGNFSQSVSSRGVTAPVKDDAFGDSVAGLEINGQTVLAVGAPGDSQGQGAVWILYLNVDGTVTELQKIDEDVGGLSLAADDEFGSAVANLGKLNDDDVPDLAVGAPRDDDGGRDQGAVWEIFLNTPPTVEDLEEDPSMPFVGDQVEVSATIKDNQGIKSAEICFRRGGDSKFLKATMKPETGDKYTISLPEGFAERSYVLNVAVTTPCVGWRRCSGRDT